MGGYVEKDKRFSSENDVAFFFMGHVYLISSLNTVPI